LSQQRRGLIGRNVALNRGPKLFKELRKPFTIPAKLLLYAGALAYVCCRVLKKCQGEERRHSSHEIFDICLLMVDGPRRLWKC